MSQSSNNRINGKVEWFNEKRGFGLIKVENKEIFAHHSEIKVNSDKYKFLKEDEIVEFSIFEVKQKHSSEMKICAKDITGVNGQKLNCENIEKKKSKKRPKNTENFEPNHNDPNMKIKVYTSNNKPTCNSNDVTVVTDLFKENINVYENLLEEIKKAKVDQNNLWKLWHGDTHLIADDHLKWKDECPIFNMIIEKIKDFFNMKIKATRFNWYKDTSQWKPFHHDAAAVKPHIAAKQNWTVAVSFGTERDAAFEHVDSKIVISIPQPDGCMYAFGNKVNIEWKHGIPQLPPDKQINEGRISIIAWGWVDM